MDSKSLPVNMVITVGGKDYKVYLPKGSVVMRKNRSSASLERFVAGDVVRFYGSIKELL